MKDIFHQGAFADIAKEGSKLRTYSSLKTLSGLENYILSGMPVQDRIAITKIRLSNHALMIEKGRHLKIDRTRRFCPFCPTYIETEQHFLLHCKTFQVLREPMLTKLALSFPDHSTMSHDELFGVLLSSNLLAPYVGSFLNRALQVREILIANQRTCE